MDENGAKHRIVLDDRKSIQISGVKDVISFDEEQIQMAIESGRLSIEGVGLHITDLSLGNGRVSAEGTVSAILYDEKENAGKKGGFFRKKG